MELVCDKCSYEVLNTVAYETVRKVIAAQCESSKMAWHNASWDLLFGNEKFLKHASKALEDGERGMISCTLKGISCLKALVKWLSLTLPGHCEVTEYVVEATFEICTRRSFQPKDNKYRAYLL